jgi:hypothetical protein
MSAAKEIAGRAPDQEQEILGRWYRTRRFGLGPFGENWWVAPLNRDKISPMGMDEIHATANGIERIEVLDVTDDIASYRQYLVNPDGDIVRVSFAPQYGNVSTMPVGRLRGIIKRMKMARENAEAPSRAQDPTVRHTAQIIPFPAHRIVRRIEHGRGVVAGR